MSVSVEGLNFRVEVGKKKGNHLWFSCVVIVA